jgi:hypothetical protein
MGPGRTYLQRIPAALVTVGLVGALTMLVISASPSASGGVERAVAAIGVVKAAKATSRLDLITTSKRKPKAEPKAAYEEGRPELAAVTDAGGRELDVTGDCAENMAIAQKQGLTLPEGWGIYCVGPGLDWDGNSHWGVTCPYDSCPEGQGPYVSVSNPTYYVIAHELCHANFGNDELMADSCAAEHGASLETSPYQ